MTPSHAVRIYKNGGPDELRFETIEVGQPGPDDVLVRHAAVGLNFTDINDYLQYLPRWVSLTSQPLTQFNGQTTVDTNTSIKVYGSAVATRIALENVLLVSLISG